MQVLSVDASGDYAYSEYLDDCLVLTATALTVLC